MLHKVLMPLTGFAVLFLTIAGVFYLAAIAGVLVNPYLALVGAAALAALAVVLCGRLRAVTLGLRDLLGPALGLILVVRMAPSVVDAISWDVVSYGLLKYPEFKSGIIGPYFSYGNVYEFLVSYADQFLPPIGGVSLFHSLSLFFLAIFALNYAYGTRSRLAVVACLLLLVLDPTRWIRPLLSYSSAGKSDVLVAALILQVWAIVLDRRDSRARPIKAIEFVAANSVAACAVGVKTSAAIALRRSAACRDLANVVVLESITDKNLVHLGMSYSAIGALGVSRSRLIRALRCMNLRSP